MAKVTMERNPNSFLNMFLKKELKTSKHKKRKKEFRIKVGLLSNYMHSGVDGNSDISVYDLAKLLNKGDNSRHIPPRPYNDMALKRGMKILEEYLKRDFNLFTYKEDLNGVLEKMITSYKLTILEFDTPPNAPLTIKNKGFDDPLIHTGKLVRSIEGQIGQGKKYGKGRNI